MHCDCIVSIAGWNLYYSKRSTRSCAYPYYFTQTSLMVVKQRVVILGIGGPDFRFLGCERSSWPLSTMRTTIFGQLSISLQRSPDP